MTDVKGELPHTYFDSCGCDSDPREALESLERFVIICDNETRGILSGRILERTARAIATPVVAIIDPERTTSGGWPSFAASSLDDFVRRLQHDPRTPVDGTLRSGHNVRVQATLDCFPSDQMKPVLLAPRKNAVDAVHVVWAVSIDQLAPVLASASSAVATSGYLDALILYLLVASRDVERVRSAVRCMFSWRRPREIVIEAYEEAIAEARRDMWHVERDKKTLGATDLGSDANFVRIYLPFVRALTDRGARHVVWLDADTLVRSDVFDLVDHFRNFQDETKLTYVAGAAMRSKPTFSQVFRTSDVWPPHLLERANNLSRTTRTTTTGCSFNAGVMVFDLPLWRRHNMTSIVEEWMMENVRHNLWDGGSQPPIMLATDGLLAPLDPTWNVCELGSVGLVDEPPPPLAGCSLSSSLLRSHNVSLKRQQRGHVLAGNIRDARILHWNGRFKPWRTPSTRVEDGRRRLKERCGQLCNRHLWISHGRKAEFCAVGKY